MPITATQTEVSDLSAGQVLSPTETGQNEIREKKLAQEDLTNLQRDQVPSNIEDARDPDEFIEPSGDVLAEEGFQILKPIGGKPEKTEPVLVEDNPEDKYAYPKDPEADPENPDWAKTNDGWTSSEKSTAREPQEEIDWDKLMVRWAGAELPVEDFPDKNDMNGPEASIIAALTRREIELAELSKQEMSIVCPDKDGEQYDVKLRVDRIENQGAKKALTELCKKYGLDYLTNIWVNANAVDIYENREGQTMIMVKAKKENNIEPFFVLSTSDFSRMLSVPSVKDGNSRIDIPPVDPKEKQDQYKLITIFANIRVSGQLIGGEDFQNYNFGRR